jgi:tRNA A-37 threonylcarbamoyl transferase component Bud32/TolB-like protein
MPLTGVVANRYRIDRKIGEGGMATVYVAHDLTRDVAVAIKTPKPELVAQLGAARFAREIQITTQLQHPHIVPVLDSGMHDGAPFYVMPLIEGESLEQRILRTGPLPIAEAITYVSEILDGLGYAHDLGFVHRDVKPANVMITRGHAQVADFGIARAVENTDNRKLTESGFALGTAEYMSPEQASGEKHLDGRSDLYSVGCVLYEMLVGAPPFSGATSRAIMARHFVDPVPAIRTVRDTVPEPLELIVFTALAKTPADRFPTARAFLDALSEPEVRATLTNPAHRTSAVRPAYTAPAQPINRTRMLVAGGVLAIAAAAGLYAWRSKTPAVAATDPNRVMVFPFEQSADLASRETLGEDVATIIGNALDSAEPLRWVDGWSSLDATQRTNLRSVSDESARALARGKRCAYVIRGRLTKVSDAIEVSLALYDVEGDSIVGRGVARGTVDDPWKQGLNAVNKVLPRLIAGDARNLLVDWEGRPPAAVANFLVGEAKFRRVQIGPALEAYRSAVALDSTFATAALRGAQAAGWAHNNAIGAALVRLALAQPLPPRSRFFALGVQAYQGGLADSAIAMLTRATLEDPDNVAAWAQLGEVYMHRLPRATTVSPDAAADDAFQRARALDSSAAILLYHPIQIRLRRGDLAGADSMLARFRAAGPDQTSLDELELAASCARTNALADTMRAGIRRAPLEFLAAGAALGTAGGNLRCATATYEVIQALDTAANDIADARRYVALVGEVTIALTRGDSARALDAVHRFEQRWPAVPSLLLTAASWSPVFASRAREVARADSVAYGPALASAPETNKIFRTALFEVANGGVSRAALLQATLAAHAALPDSQALRWYADAIDAHVRLARGDSSGAESGLQRIMDAPLTTDNLQWDITVSRGLERLTLARLLLARGRAQEAWHVANVFDSPVPMVYVAFLPASLELRATAARMVGDVASERQFRSRLAAFSRAP